MLRALKTTAGALCDPVEDKTLATCAGTLEVKVFEIPGWNRESPDFVSLSDDALTDIVSRRTWLEWKVLRQYQMLFSESLLSMRCDPCVRGLCRVARESTISSSQRATHAECARPSY